MGNSLEIGGLGEKLATKYLIKNGFLIRELNWRNGRYEIDIIAERYGVIHFVEVKTRKAGSWSTPEQAINESKFRSLRRAASAYLAIKAIRYEHQFDLIAIEMEEGKLKELRYIEKAMQVTW